MNSPLIGNSEEKHTILFGKQEHGKSAGWRILCHKSMVKIVVLLTSALSIVFEKELLRPFLVICRCAPSHNMDSLIFCDQTTIRTFHIWDQLTFPNFSGVRIACWMLLAIPAPNYETRPAPESNQCNYLIINE